jgi:hypothetical protein
MRRARLAAALALMLACWGTAHPAAAADLVLCVGGRTVAVAGAAPDGDTAPPCPATATLRLPVDADDVVWARLLDPVAEAAAGYVLSETPEQSGRIARAAEPLPTTPSPAAPEMAVPGDDLARIGPFRPFGVEGRVAVTPTAEGLRIACAPGTLPAGALLGPVAVPRIAGLSIALDAATDAHWAVGLGDPARPDAGPVALATVGPGAGRQALRPDAPGTVREIVFVCPGGAGDMLIRGAVVTAATGPTAPYARSAWSWDPARWRDAPEALLAEAARRNLDTLFVAVEVVDGAVADAARLTAFVTAAGARAIAVWAVEGDPAAVTQAGLPPFVARTRAIARHQRSAPPAGRLAGLQYDIEPYILDPAALDAPWPVAYGDALRTLLAETGDLPIDLVVPFWMTSLPDAMAAAIDPSASRIAALTVMAYRSDPAAVARIAAPLLDWGVARSVPVRVALEALPLPDERRTTFRPTGAGTGAGRLWRVPIGGRHALILLRGPATPPVGTAFEGVATTVVPGARISFQGDAARLDAILPGLGDALSRWGSFAGFALHGIL